MISPQQSTRNYFNEFYFIAIEKAKRESENHIKNLKLDGLDLSEKILLLHSHICKLNSNIQSFEKIEYFYFADYEDIVYALFFSRLLFQKKNEKNTVIKAIRLFFLLKELKKQQAKLKQDLPPFSMDDFMKGTSNVQFYQLNEKPNHTDIEIYKKMCYIQECKLIQCILLESNQFKKNIIENLKQTVDPWKYIISIRDQLGKIANYATEYNLDKFKSEIVNLPFISLKSLPLDFQEFHNAFSEFVSGNLQTAKYTVPFFDSNLGRIKNKELSDPSIFCYSLNHLDEWLKNMSLQKIQDANLQADFLVGLFEKTVSQQLQITEKEIQNFNLNYNNDSITTVRYKKILFDAIEEMRLNFNDSKAANYYKNLFDEGQLKSTFILNCIKFGNWEKEVQNLSIAIHTTEKLNFLLDELEKIEKYSSKILNDSSSIEKILQVNYPIIHLAPSSDIMKLLFNLHSCAITHLKKADRPISFLIEDIKEKLSNIYDATLDYLKKEFNSTIEIERIELFLLEKKRDIELKKQSLKRKNYELNDCFNDLKKFFNSNLKFLSETSKIQDIQIDELLSQPEREDDPFNESLYFKLNVKQNDFRITKDGPIQYSDINNPNAFSLVEIELHRANLIDGDYNFIEKKGNKILLATIYKILIQRNYFRKNHRGKKLEPCHYRQYLDNRYNVDTHDAFKRINPKRINDTIDRYSWIKNIEYCR